MSTIEEWFSELVGSVKLKGVALELRLLPMLTVIVSGCIGEASLVV